MLLARNMLLFARPTVCCCLQDQLATYSTRRTWYEEHAVFCEEHAVVHEDQLATYSTRVETGIQLARVVFLPHTYAARVRGSTPCGTCVTCVREGPWFDSMWNVRHSRPRGPVVRLHVERASLTYTRAARVRGSAPCGTCVTAGGEAGFFQVAPPESPRAAKKDSSRWHSA